MVKETETPANDEQDNRRSFEYVVDGGLKKFFLGMPTSEQIRKAEWHYSKVYNKALVEGVATSSEMMDILTRRGIYGQDYDDKLRSLQTSIGAALNLLDDATDDEKREDIALEVERLRDELFRWNQRITGPLSNCCEQMAEDAKAEYLTSVTVQDSEGNLIWDSYDSFVTEKDQGFALKARFEVMLWLQGLDPDFLEKTPEQIVLHELALKRAEEVKKANEVPAQLPEAKAAAEDSEEDEESKPKKTRKRRTTKSKTK